MKSLSVVVIISVILSIAVVASAQQTTAPPPAPSNAATHDVAVVAVQDEGQRRHDGFFLRMNAGPSFLASFGERDTTITGFGPSLNLSIGGAPVENFIIHGDFYFTSALDPNVDVGNSSYESDGILNNTSFGAGVTYYFMPVNFYLTGGLSYTNWHFVADEGEDSDVHHGVGTRLMFGKEWWVGDDWGLGIAGQVAFNFTSADESDLSSISTGVLFSATYQ